MSQSLRLTLSHLNLTHAGDLRAYLPVTMTLPALRLEKTRFFMEEEFTFKDFSLGFFSF